MAETSYYTQRTEAFAKHKRSPQSTATHGFAEFKALEYWLRALERYPQLMDIANVFPMMSPNVVLGACLVLAEKLGKSGPKKDGAYQNDCAEYDTAVRFLAKAPAANLEEFIRMFKNIGNFELQMNTLALAAFRKDGMGRLEELPWEENAELGWGSTIATSTSSWTSSRKRSGARHTRARTCLYAPSPS